MAFPNKYTIQEQKYKTIDIDISSESPYREEINVGEENIYPGQILTYGYEAIYGVAGVYPNEIDSQVVGLQRWKSIWVAMEDLSIGKTIYDSYAPGEKLPVRVLRKGDVCLARLAFPYAEEDLVSRTFPRGFYLKTGMGQIYNGVYFDYRGMLAPIDLFQYAVAAFEEDYHVDATQSDVNDVKQDLLIKVRILTQ